MLQYNTNMLLCSKIRGYKWYKVRKKRRKYHSKVPKKGITKNNKNVTFCKKTFQYL